MLTRGGSVSSSSFKLLTREREAIKKTLNVSPIINSTSPLVPQSKNKKTPDSAARENDPPALDKPAVVLAEAAGATAVTTDAADAAVAVVVKKAKKPRCSNPGVRVQGGRIYDSANGTTCHQVSD